MHVEARPRILLVDRSIGAHPIDQDIPSRVATGYGVDSALLDLLWAPKSSCQFWSREHGPCCALQVENKPKGTPRHRWSQWIVEVNDILIFHFEDLNGCEIDENNASTCFGRSSEFYLLSLETFSLFICLFVCLFVFSFFLSFFLSSAILYVSLICQYGHATRCSATITIVYSISVTCCNLSMPRKMFSAVSSADCLRHVVFACPLISTSGVQTPSRAARFPTMESCEEFCLQKQLLGMHEQWHFMECSIFLQAVHFKKTMHFSLCFDMRNCDIDCKCHQVCEHFINETWWIWILTCSPWISLIVHVVYIIYTWRTYKYQMNSCNWYMCDCTVLVLPLHKGFASIAGKRKRRFSTALSHRSTVAHGDTGLKLWKQSIFLQKSERTGKEESPIL